MNKSNASGPARPPSFLLTSACSGNVACVKPHQAYLFGAALLFAAGCKTTPEIRPFTDEQLRGFYSAAQDPRRFWLTPYQSDAGPVYSGANRLHPEKMAQFRFRGGSKSTAPIIPFKGDHPQKEYMALIDTTSEKSWFSLATARDIGVVPLAPPSAKLTPEHVQESIAGYATVVKRLVLDQCPIETALVFTRGASGPIDALARGEKKPTPVAVFGYDLLQQFAFIQFDLVERTVTFSTSIDYKPEPETLLAAVPFFLQDGALAVKGAVEGEPSTILIDIAGDFELVLKEPRLDPVRRMSLGSLMVMKVNPAIHRDFNLGLTDYPRVGRQLLSRFKITISNKQRKIFFERPSRTPTMKAE